MMTLSERSFMAPHFSATWLFLRHILSFFLRSSVEWNYIKNCSGVFPRNLRKIRSGSRHLLEIISDQRPEAWGALTIVTLPTMTSPPSIFNKLIKFTRHLHNQWIHYPLKPLTTRASVDDCTQNQQVSCTRYHI